MPMNSVPIAQQRVLVTGATRGLGRAITLALLEAGAAVAAVYWLPTRRRRTTWRKAGRGTLRQLLARRCDITDTRELDALLFAGIAAGAR